MSLKASETIKNYQMLDGCRAVVAGVSGGADSMALLHFLCTLRKETGLTVYAAHVNHGLRGEEALRDERYVEQMCALWDVRLFVLHEDIGTLAGKTGESQEQCGRRVRYEFFDRLARENNAKIATAHTLSDCMETVFINIARGTGLKGLCGIPPVRGNIIRPLICDTRRDTEEYCALHAIEYKTDSTNFSREYSRNRIRLDIIPLFNEINPSFAQSVQRMFHNLSEDERFLARLAKIKLEQARDGNSYNAKVLSELDPALLSRILILLLKNHTQEEPESAQIESMKFLLRKGSGRVQLKGGWFAEIAKHTLYIERHTSGPAPDPFQFPLREGTVQNKKYLIQVETVEFVDNNLKKFNKQYFKNMLDCDKIKGNPVIRGRIEGEGYHPAGRNAFKTLKKLMNEDSVPVELRSSLPCAADDAGILWACGFGPDERCKITEHTKKAFKFSIKYLEGHGNDRRY